MEQCKERKGIKGFAFSRSYYESAMCLTDKQRLAIYDAILEYSFDGAAPVWTTQDDAVAEAIFALIKPTLDNSLKKSEAGAKGGKSKREANADQDASKTEANGKQMASKAEASGKQSGIKIEANGKQKMGSQETGFQQAPINMAGDTRNTSCGTLSAEVCGADLKQQRFDEFWKAYPRKTGKGAAKKAWSRIMPTAELHKKILAAVAQQKKSLQWNCDNGRYIPNPLKWLNEARWEDEPQEGSASAKFGQFAQRDYSDDFYDTFTTNEFGMP